MGDVSRFFNPDKVDFYREDIRSELELLFENGRFSRQSHEFNEYVISEGNVDDQTVNRLESEDCPNESHELGDANSERGAQAVSPDQQSRRTEDLEHDCASIRDCLLKCSFYHSEFDSEKFLVMAETMMDKVFSRSDEKNNKQCEGGYHHLSREKNVDSPFSYKDAK